MYSLFNRIIYQPRVMITFDKEWFDKSAIRRNISLSYFTFLISFILFVRHHINNIVRSQIPHWLHLIRSDLTNLRFVETFPYLISHFLFLLYYLCATISIILSDHRYRNRAVELATSQPSKQPAYFGRPCRRTIDVFQHNCLWSPISSQSRLIFFVLIL